MVGEAFVLAIAAFAHRDVAQRVLRRLKYGGGRRLAQPLAEEALPAFRGLLTMSGPAPLVPVPLHADRLRTRGYNQAALLAEHLGRRCGLETWAALERRRPTDRQHRLDRAARIRNLDGAFGLHPRTAAALRTGRAPPAVILIDDILTTSATMEACAAVLLAAGVDSVYGFAFAREV